MNVSKIEEIYERFKNSQGATAGHLETIRMLAMECDIVVELGVRNGASISALLLGTKEKVYGYDIKDTTKARILEEAARGKFIYKIQNTLDDKCIVPSCNMIFFDSLHTYEQLQMELIKHGNKADKYLLFHDTITFGIQAADGETGRVKEGFERGVFNPKVHGIRLAIDEYMMLRPQWKIKFHHPYCHGLLCLERMEEIKWIT